MRELPNMARERLAAGPVSSPHLDPNLISAFAEHALLAGERQRVIAHMADCEQCRTEVQLVIAAAQPEARVPVAVPGAARPWWQGWQFLLRWQTASAAVAVAAISLAFWFAPRQRPTSRAIHYTTTASEATPATMAGKAAPALSSAGSAAGRANLAARSQPPAPATPRPLSRLLTPSRESRAELSMPELKAHVSPAPNTITGQLVGGTVEPEASIRVTDSSLKNALAAAPPPPVPASQPPKASAAGLSAEVAQPAPGAISTAVPARGVAEAPAVMSLHFAAKAAVAPRQVELKNGPSAVRWEVRANAAGQSEGAVEKSVDGGRTWQPVPVAEGVAFRVVFALGGDVWAGGAAGAFFHSGDAGRNWSAVPLPKASTSANAAPGDIISIQFDEAAHGVVTSSSGASWVTSDGGQTWQTQ